MDFIGFNEANQAARLPTDTASEHHVASTPTNPNDPLDLGDDEREPNAAAAERRGLLDGADEPLPPPASVSGTPSKKPRRVVSGDNAYWTRIILWASAATIVRRSRSGFISAQTGVVCCAGEQVVGLAETVIAFWMSSRSVVVLTVSCVALALCALLAVTLSALAIVAVRDLADNPASSFAALSFYLNTGLMLCVTLITLGVTVMSLQPDFVRYVELHWGDGDDDVALRWGGAAGAAAASAAAGSVSIGATDEDTELTHRAAVAAATKAAEAASKAALAAASAEMTGAVHSIGALAIGMALLLVVSVYSSAHVRPAHMPVFGVQSYLWVHLVIGVWGAVLLSLSIYALYHEYSLPISSTEGVVLRVMGALLFGTSLLGLYRVYSLTEAADAAGDGSSRDGWSGLGAGWLLQSQHEVDNRQIFAINNSGAPSSGGAFGGSGPSRRGRRGRTERRQSHRDGTGAGVLAATTHDEPGDLPAPLPAADPHGGGNSDSGGETDGEGSPRRRSASQAAAANSAWGQFKSWAPVVLHVLTLGVVALLLCYTFLVWVYRSVPEHATSYLRHRQWLADDAHMELQHNPTKLALVLHIKLALLSVSSILSAAYVGAGAVLAGYLEAIVKRERASLERL